MYPLILSTCLDETKRSHKLKFKITSKAFQKLSKTFHSEKCPDSQNAIICFINKSVKHQFLIQIPSQTMLWVWVHLHYQIFRFLTSFVAKLGFFIQENCSKTMEKERQTCQSIRPTQIVEIRVHQPIPSDMGTTKDRNRKKHKYS